MYEPSIQLRYYKGSYKQVRHHEVQLNLSGEKQAKQGTESPSFSVLKEEVFCVSLKKQTQH